MKKNIVGIGVILVLAGIMVGALSFSATEQGKEQMTPGEIPMHLFEHAGSSSPATPLIDNAGVVLASAFIATGLFLVAFGKNKKLSMPSG